MYQISNKDRDEIIKLLSAINEIPKQDTKTANTKRRAKLVLKKLKKQTQYIK